MSRKKLILGVGEVLNIECIQDYFELKGESRIGFGKDVARNVTEAINGLNSGQYWGVLMTSLVLPMGMEADKYNELSKKFSKFDDPPAIWRSGGLYIVEQACNKGLITVVNRIAEEKRHMEEAQRLGAHCFEEILTTAQNNLEYLQSKLKA